MLDRKSEFDLLLEDINDPEARKVVNRAFNPVRAAMAWLDSQSIKYNAADVIALAALIKNDLP